MLERNKICVAIGTAFGIAVIAPIAHAQQPQQQQLERVEVTGSSIKRIDAETALPVQILRREDIERTGATSVTDLLQKLPVIQGQMTVEGDSVGGGGAGFAGVSIHGLGETRTVVLLNGRRLATFGGSL